MKYHNTLTGNRLWLGLGLLVDSAATPHAMQGGMQFGMQCAIQLIRSRLWKN